MLLLASLFVLLHASLAVAAPTVHDLRAARRAAVRSAALAKADGGAPFGLLVLPVDFADARFPAGYDPEAVLGARLAGDFSHYFGLASQGRTTFAVTLAPVISLAGERQDYSDIGWQGNERSRAMASEALAHARDVGMDFAAADRDGDGEVDGILLLHAAPGLENDPAGLIVPLQFFLDEPVVDRGTIARSYAVVAERSSLGIWAHEAAHLLGLEDRYDPGLPGSGETGASGGLGRFSLMASGWLGTGDGHDPSLPDAYSRLALGWADLGDEASPGTVVRLRMTDPGGAEYFLAEQRRPLGAVPYDAVIPPDRLLVYHVDTALAEGQASSPTWPRHLRVQLVEADGGEELARGENDGSPDDLFPFANETQILADGTIPDARTWSGEATGVDIEVSSGATGLDFEDRGRELQADLRLILEAADRFQPLALVAGGEDAPASLSFELRVDDTTWGHFASGATATGELVRVATGGWASHLGTELAWVAAGDPPPGAVTTFTYTLDGGAYPDGEVAQVWDETWADLDLADDWPGAWQLDQPGGDTATVWHRWLAGGLALPAGPLLACTGSQHTSAADWPAVAYANDAHARLRTPLLGTDVRWLELRHSPHLELLHAGAAVDGVGLTWVHAGGTRVTATPADGWLGAVDPRARQPLAGAPTFAVSDPLLDGDRPLWRREILAVPDPVTAGPGPWRLELELASTPLYADRGWLVHALAAHLDGAPASAFPVWFEGSDLRWTWDLAEEGGQCFEVQRSDDGGQTWRTALTTGDQAVPRGSLGLVPGVRSRIRVLAGCVDQVASRTILAAGPAEPTLSLPRPNPCNGEARIRIDGAGDPQTEVALFDLRGRRLRDWRPGGESVEVVWKGDDASGRRVAAGVYIFRLRAQGRTLTRKVTWLH